MAYQSFFSGSNSGSTTTAPKGGGYQSFFGNTVAKTGSIAAAQAVKKPQVATQQQPKQQTQPKQSTSLFNKVVKPLASAAVTSENTVAKGIARTLPGGTNDIKAQTDLAKQADQATAQIMADKKAGKISAARATKLINNQAQNSQAAVQDQTKTIKAMPTKGQLAAGFAGTAADILTAGSLSKIEGGAKAGLTVGKLGEKLGVKGGKAASLLGNSKKAKSAEQVLALSGNATAGGLNAAAGGGTKKDIIKNAAAGAVFPEVLHYGGKAVVKGGATLLDKTGLPDARELQRTAKINSLLDKVRPPETVAATVTTPHVNSVPASELSKVDTAMLPDRSPAMAEPATGPEAAVSGTPSAHDNAVATIKQHMADNYTPASDHPDEAFAADHLQNNTDKALKAYQARTTKIFGSKNIVGGDDAKYAVPNMEAGKSVHYHEPSSEFAKGYYKHLLTDPETTHKPVMITAGGTGAGKTSALKKYFVDNGGDVNDYAAIVDTNLTNLHSATSRIEPALATGHDVTVNYVYRDPVEAFQNGVIPRAAKEGRAVVAATHADTHASSLDAIKQIAEKYKDNPKVHIEIHDNSRGAGNAKVVNLDFLKDKSYTKGEIEAKIHTLLDNQLREGKLTNEQHTIFKGEDKPVTAKPTAKPGTSNSLGKTGDDVRSVEQKGSSKAQRQPEQERPSRGVANSDNVMTYQGKSYTLSGDALKRYNYAKTRLETSNNGQGRKWLGRELSSVKRQIIKEGKEIKPVVEQKANTKPAGKSILSKTAKPEPKTLTPVQTSHMPEISGYTHSSHMEKDYADMLRQQEQSVKGGQIIKNADGSYRRTSEHSRFYRDFYKENGKAPTKSDYLQQAKLELKSDKDYKTLLKREAEPIPTPDLKIKPMENVGWTKTSKLARGVESNAVAAKLTKTLGELPQYSKVNMKEQGKFAVDILENDQQKAIDIALGKTPPPAHILPEAVYTAVETKALASGDVDLLRALANSHLVSEATAMGQRIRALGERDVNSPVAAIRSIKDARTKAFEAKSKTTAPKAVQAEVRAIRAGKPKVTKETFASFVDSLRC